MKGYNTRQGINETASEQDHGSPHVASHASGVVEILWQRRRSVLLTVVVCCALGMGYIIYATPIFTACAKLLVEQSGPKIITSNEGFMTQSKNYLHTQCELLMSSPIVAGAIDRLRGKKLRTFEESTSWLRHLKRNLTAKVGKRDDIISVRFDSPYPEEASQIVNAIVNSYVAYHATQQKHTVVEVLKILQDVKVKREKKLQIKVQAITTFKKKHKILSLLTDRSDIIVTRLEELSSALTAAELEMMDAQARMEAAQEALQDSTKIHKLAESQGPSNSLAEVDKLLLKLARLREECTPEHPAIKTIESKLHELAQQWASALEQQHLIAEKRVNKLHKMVVDQCALAEELNSVTAEHAMMQADLKRSENFCNLIDAQIKDINITEDAGAMYIRILENAKTPPAPSKPKKARLMSLAIVLGIFLGAGVALLGNWMDQRFQSTEEISQALDLPTLGVIPHLANSGSEARTVELEPLSTAAEAFRIVRTAVYFGTPEGKAKTLLITSAESQAGKSIFTSNLGIAMAQAGNKVLILDADFRKPVQHKNFCITDNGVGLPGVLAGNHSLNDAIHHTEVDGLDVLVCGEIPHNPAEILNSRAFADTLQQLTESYDHILLDAPPVLPVTDACILGALTDTAILVLRPEKSRRRPSQHAVEELLRVGTQILGVVVNDADANKRLSGYYGYGSRYGNTYYAYGYGQDNDKKESKSKYKSSKKKKAELVIASAEAI